MKSTVLTSTMIEKINRVMIEKWKGVKSFYT